MLRHRRGLRHVGAREVEQVLRIRRAAVAELDIDRRHLAGMRVRLADRADEGDVGMLHQRILDQPGVDVVAATDDDVLGPTGDPDVAVAVDPPEVPVRR
jgi:hypothetical protein